MVLVGDAVRVEVATVEGQVLGCFMVVVVLARVKVNTYFTKS